MPFAHDGGAFGREAARTAETRSRVVKAPSRF